MKLIVNGEDREFSSNLTVASLLVQLGMKPDRVAVELNRDLLPRERWDKTHLSDDDKLEIVHFVGGGLDSKYPHDLSSAKLPFAKQTTTQSKNP